MAVFAIAAAAILALGSAQFLLADGEAAECAGACKRPPLAAGWSYQLQNTPRLIRSAYVYDVDGFDAPASYVSRLHRLGGYAVCYINAGTWEDWRPDRQRFPDSVLGEGNGWPGERWLDIRQIATLTPIMRDRIAQCREKGFDAVEPDNVDGYANATGFPLTAEHQLRYNQRLALLAHGAGMAVALKNDLEQVPVLEKDFDFAIVEQCFEYSECDLVQPFVAAGKPVFAVEYSLAPASFCGRAKQMRINAVSAPVELDRPSTPC